MRIPKQAVAIMLGLCLLAPASLCRGETEKEKVEHRWYSCSSKDRDVVGYFHIMRKDSGYESAPVLLQYEAVVIVEGKELQAKTNIICKDDEYFTPVKIEQEQTYAAGDGITHKASISIEWSSGDAGKSGVPEGFAEGKLRGNVRGKTVELPIPEHTVTEFAMFEIVRRLPIRKDTSFQFNLLTLESLRVQESQKVVYGGREEIEIGGQKRKLHKFEHRAELETKTEYWVDDNRELIRVVFQGRDEMVLTSEARAKKLVRNGAQKLAK